MQLGLQSGLPLLIKLLTLKPWREKINTSCQSFGCTRKSWQWEPFFFNGSIDALSGGTSPVKGQILKFFFILGNALPTQNPMNSTAKVLKWFVCPQTQCLIQPLDQRVIKDLYAPYTQNSMERINNTIENLQRQNILKVWNNYTIEDAIILTEKSTKVIKHKTITSC